MATSMGRELIIQTIQDELEKLKGYALKIAGFTEEDWRASMAEALKRMGP